MENVVSMADYRHDRAIQEALAVLAATELKALLFIAVPASGDDNVIGTVAVEDIDRDKLVQLLEIQKSAILADNG